VTIGRSRSCTVTLRDPAASRSHAAVVLRPGDTRARDLQSSNGTYLNGERLLGEKPVKDGDKITIGETDIFIRITAPVMMEEVAGATVRIDAARLQCPSCGSELPLHAEICPRCGHRMGGPDIGGGRTTVFEPGMVPPASAPAAPPPAAPLAPPGISRTEIYRDAQPVAPPVPEHTIRESFGSELLPPIGDESSRAPGPTPALPPPPPPRAAQPLAPQAAAAPLPPAPRPAPVPQPMPQPMAPASALRPAGFFIRLAAYLVDVLWMAALATGVSFAFGGPMTSAGSTAMALSGLVLWLGVAVLGWAVLGATPGKLLLGLRVIAAGRQRGVGFGVAIMRLCGTMVSGILGIGYLMVAFTKDKRALHDHLAGTMVVRR
jgi:uncharacterized RDD family membrane protein YckC